MLEKTVGVCLVSRMKIRVYHSEFKIRSFEGAFDCKPKAHDTLPTWYIGWVANIIQLYNVHNLYNVKGFMKIVITWKLWFLFYLEIRL